MHSVDHGERLPLDGRWRFQLLGSPEAPDVMAKGSRHGVSGCRMAAAARAPNTSPSSSELLARRLAP
jgi:hypothetical protein